MDAIQEEPMPCAEHQAVHQDVARHREDIIKIYGRLEDAAKKIIDLNGQLETDRKLRLKDQSHLEEKIDDLKTFFSATFSELKGMIENLKEGIDARVSDLEKGPGKRALEDQRKLIFEAVKWIMIIGLGAVVAFGK